MHASTGPTWTSPLPRNFNDVVTVPLMSIDIIRHTSLLASYPNFLTPFGFAAASDHPSLYYIANVSILNYLALVLCINIFLSPPSCRSQEDPSLPLITLVHRLSKILLLLYDFYLLIYNMVADTDKQSIDTTSLGFDQLDGILVQFGAHWKNLTIHKNFDVAYSQNLLDLDDLFSDGTTRTQLKSDVIK